LYVKDPLLLPFTFNNIVDIGVGNYHNIILTVYEAYGFGCNNCNQLGLTEELNYDTPQQLDLYGPFVACAAGASHSVIITTTDIYGCGNNLYGQLGVGNTKHCDKFTKIDIKDAISVKCGEFYTMVLTKHNTLYSFGDNYYGTLGFKIDYATIPQQIFTKYNVVNFSCGYNHAIVCTKGKRKNSKFKYHVMGSNKYAQLGLGRYKKAIIKIPKLLTL
jgi:alpha-tubulin suppressor-like RCC1 family protein